VFEIHRALAAWRTLMTDDVKLCVEILEKAIHFEETGMAFFKERAQNAPSQLERNLFQSLAKDEAGHKAHLVKMRDDLLAANSVDVLQQAADHDHAAPREIFEKALADSSDPYEAESDELEIIKGAMDIERNGYAMYSSAVDQVTSERAKEIFRHLAAEEQNHYSLLKNTYDYLSEPEAWHGFDESPMLDG
jgi:rubrerythrin